MIRYNRFPEGRTKCMTLSYDDGNTADYRLVEVINRYGVRGTFHLNSATLGAPRIEKDAVNTLYKGHEIALHSASHPSLPQGPICGALGEVYEDRATMESLTGTIIRGMSYPYGTYNDAIISMLKSVGVCYCRTVASTLGFAWPANFLTWHPTCHHKDSLERAGAFMTTHNRGALFYVWGHSYEFDNNDNWDLLEKLCQTVTTDAGEAWYQKADNVWFATNIEIYDYITAVRNLVVSLDQKIIYNPSSIPVWVENANEAIRIGGGETVKL